MTKVLVVQGNPDPESFIAACASEFTDAARRGRHEVRIADLAVETFDPNLKFGYRLPSVTDPFIEESIVNIQWAEHIAVFSPVWWASVPAVLKGWFDRVLLPGVAYSTEPGGGDKKHTELLGGRTATLVMSSGEPSTDNAPYPEHPAPLIVNGIFAFCGIEVTRTALIGDLGSGENPLKRREAFIASMRDIADSL